MIGATPTELTPQLCFIRSFMIRDYHQMYKSCTARSWGWLAAGHRDAVAQEPLVKRMENH